MAANALSWINKKAKSLTRAHPNMAWATARDKASAEYRRTHKTVAGVKKRKPAKKAARRPAAKKAVKRRRVAAVKKTHRVHRVHHAGHRVMGAVEHLKAAKNILQDKYGLLAARLTDDKLKSPARKKIIKEMSQLKTQIRKIDSK